MIHLVFTSMCKFPMYDVNFDQERDIKVWITLKEEDMAKFETDEVLLISISLSEKYGTKKIIILVSLST